MNDYDIQLEVDKQREQIIYKANQIIQKARYQLSLREMKIMQYLFSKVKPNDNKETWYTFSIKDFCMVCGIDYKSGQNYENVKKLTKGLRDKSLWVMQADGSEVTVGWLGKVYINKGSGKIKIKFDEDMSQYINGLMNNYTQYTFLNILPMKSAYSVRLYELLKSYSFTKQHTFQIEELKKKLQCEHYERFGNFRQKVLEVATEEINLYTDINVSWEPAKYGTKVMQVIFHISEKSPIDKSVAANEAYAEIEDKRKKK